MKTIQSMKYALLSAALLFFLPAFSQQEADYEGLPGENFSLQGALELFKKSDSLEDFEKELNRENNYVNNLDLNRDGQVDYVRVIDYMEDGRMNAIVLQAVVNAEESQDVAVIEIEKTGDASATLQIVGDEDLYGKELVLEPYDFPSENDESAARSNVTVNVWSWPAVRYVHRPGYRAWVSPYRWGYYPRYWNPWRPRTVVVYRPLVVRYQPHYRVAPVHRVVQVHRFYAPRRTSSVVVRNHVAEIKSNRAAAGNTSPRSSIREKPVSDGKSKLQTPAPQKETVVKEKTSTQTIRKNEAANDRTKAPVTTQQKEEVVKDKTSKKTTTRQNRTPDEVRKEAAAANKKEATGARSSTKKTLKKKDGKVTKEKKTTTKVRKEKKTKGNGSTSTPRTKRREGGN